MIYGRPLRALDGWITSRDCTALFEQMVENFQSPQKPEQLALALSVILCRERLFPDTADDAAQPVHGSYLADLNAILNSQSLGNTRTVVERMICSFV